MIETGLKRLETGERQINDPQRNQYGDGDVSSFARPTQFGFTEELDVSADHQHGDGQQGHDAVQNNVVLDAVRHSEHVVLDSRKKKTII